MVKKFYMDTKKGTLEQSVLDVWKEAAKKQPETEHGSGEHAYEIGTDRFANYTSSITPGQVKETLDSMSEENFDLMLQESDEETLWGIVALMSEENLDEKGLLKKIGGAAIGGVAKVAKRYGTTAGRAGGAEKKLAKMKTKQKDKARLAKAKAGIKKLKQKNEYDPSVKESLKDTVVNMWKEAASSAVDPNERDELDGGKNATGKGGVETAKKMKRAKEPAPAIAAEEKIDETNKNDKSDDGEGLDAVQPKAVKKKFKDRIDKDIDNDGDTDDSDKFLHKRRKAISKAVKADEELTIEEVQDFKVSSMRDALIQVWSQDQEEGYNPYGKKKMKKAEDWKMGYDKKKKKMEDEEEPVKGDKTLTGKKTAAIDVEPKLKP